MEPRTFKDVYPRYKTMSGYRVPRKGGWDCHGLPVELEVEKEIGTTGKKDIEAFGVARFNDLCRASVQRYVGDFERLTERIGFWIDMSDAYVTMSTPYIESVWWSLKRLFERGLLQEDHKVTAYCPRCGTALSDAEVSLGYQHVEDPSIVVRFPLTEAPDASLVGASLAVWTTTPWTLPANVGAAVDESARYVEVERDGVRIVVGAPLADRALGAGVRVLRTLAGSDLVGARYAPPYPNVEGAHAVVAGDFVSMEDGTGIVHLAPAFGAPDLAVGRTQGWPVVKPVGDDGTFTEDAPSFVRGLFVKDADPAIVEDLRERGLLLDEGRVEHAYPFCWRCGTPLLYYARAAWYVRTTAVKDRLLAVNDAVHWYPDHIRRGRYGNWLENNVDWAISRERYWGTPLPIWRCEEGHATVVGSLTELSALAGRDVTGMDPHRPLIDDVTIACPDCGGRAVRVPEVIDAWYDSGAMPFAQWGYHPELGRGEERFAEMFPADFISEAIDQTRGWFYTLMAEGVLQFDESAYRNVVCLGHIVAEDGRKMSKSLGNVFDPWEALDRQGADALRWWMLTSGSPWEPRRIGHDILDEAVRQLLLPLWNTYAFFVTYANASGYDPARDGRSDVPDPRPVMDRWIASQLAGTVREARDRLDAYDATGAGRRIQAFLDDLSNWYVRRCRRRFWNPGGEGGADSEAAFATLWRVPGHARPAPGTLHAVRDRGAVEEPRRGQGRTTRLRAPIRLPLAEGGRRRSRARRRDGRGASDRGARPARPGGDEDPDASAAQPRDRAPVEPRRRRRELLPLVAEELNVRDVSIAATAESFGTWRAKPDFKVLGPRLGARVQRLAAALDDADVARRLASGETLELEIGDGAPVAIGPDDVELTHDVAEGWGVASDGGITVALELALTPELESEGRAREVIRLVQDARKEAGLAVGDRIVLGIAGALEAAVRAHEDLIAHETLALGVEPADLADAAYRREAEVGGAAVTITLRRA